MLAFAAVESLLAAGASGVASNTAFDAVFAVCMLAGLVGATMPDMPRVQWAAPLLLGVCFLPAGHPVLHGGTAARMKHLAEAEQEYAADLAYLRGIPGPALCEDLLLCHEAGKPLLYEPFNASEYIRAGRVKAQALVEDLRAHRFAVLVLERPPSKRFPPEILAAMHSYYQVKRETATRTFLRP